MASLLVSAANVSEGRRLEVIAALKAAAEQHAPVLDVHSDPDHHRTVITVAGETASLLEALTALAAQAVARIDLRSHSGQHPRLGALDVVPLAPPKGEDLRAAGTAAHELGRRLVSQLRLPCFFYEEAVEGGRTLPEVRRRAFKDLHPDVGGNRPHPTAGAVCIGARRPLVAYNVVLDAGMEVAREIASRVRESGGGLPGVRALAFELPSRGRVQVSMNLLSPFPTSPRDAYWAVSRLAEELEAKLEGAEIVGLAPEALLSNPGEMGVSARPRALEEALGLAGLPLEG